MALVTAYLCQKHGSMALWYVPARLSTRPLWRARKRRASEEEVAAADAVFGERERHRPMPLRTLVVRAQDRLRSHPEPTDDSAAPVDQPDPPATVAAEPVRPRKRRSRKAKA